MSANPPVSLSQSLKAYFGPERWTRLLKQMAMRGLEPQALADHITSIRGMQHAGNEAAWVVKAAHHALLLCGSVPSPQDYTALLQAINTSAPKPAKLGGKHDPAPPSA